jgi:hypothetical protein
MRSNQSILQAPAASGGKLARRSFSEGGSIKNKKLCKTNPICLSYFAFRSSYLKFAQSPRRISSGKNIFLRIFVAKRWFFWYNPGCLKVLRTDKREEKAIFMEQDGVFAHHIISFMV